MATAGVKGRFFRPKDNRLSLKGKESPRISWKSDLHMLLTEPCRVTGNDFKIHADMSFALCYFSYWAGSPRETVQSRERQKEACCTHGL